MSNPEILKTEIAKALGLKSAGLSVSLRRPLAFQSNRLYDLWADGCHFIAKEYLHPEEQHVAPLREYKALRLLSALDIAPQPLFYDPAIGPMVVYEYMEGEMWDRRRASAAELSNLADAWLKVNSASADWPSRGFERSLSEMESEFHRQLTAYLDWAMVEFKPGERAAELCMSLLERRHSVFQQLGERVPIPCFCRADPRFANVIQRPDGRIGLVDWEDSGLRDPARDLADILTHPNQEDLIHWQDWQAFMTPYLSARGKFDPEIAPRAHLYLAIFPLFWLVMIIRRGISLASTGGLTDWSINSLAANERLRRYLARGLAWPAMDFEPDLDTVKSIVFFPNGRSR